MNVATVISVLFILIRVVSCFHHTKWGSISNENFVEILGISSSIALMASSQVEFPSSSSPFGCVLNRRSTPKTSYNSFLHSCIPKSPESPNNHSQTIRNNNVVVEAAADLSWLPSSESDCSNHLKKQENVHDSWLPTMPSESDRKTMNGDESWLPAYYDSNKNKKNNKPLTTSLEADDSNHQKSKNDFDYSWLPTTFIVSKENKHMEENIIINNNNNKGSIPLKPKNTDGLNENRCREENNINNNKKESILLKPKNVEEQKENKPKDENINNNNNNNGVILLKPKDVDGWARARQVVFSCTQQIQNEEIWNPSMFQREVSPSGSECSMEVPNGGVSSLLRRWRDLAEAKNSSKKENSSNISSRSNSGSVFNENNHPFGSSRKEGSEVCDVVVERCTSPTTIEDSLADWDSGKSSPSGHHSCSLPCPGIKDSNAIDEEKEKIRVADIIKKLSGDEELAASLATGNGNESSLRITNLENQHGGGELKGFSAVRGSPRLIRGRQAFNNFLLQMEQDKRRELEALVERKPVTKFSYRGRIQALLRVRFLRLGVEAKTESLYHRRTISKTLEMNRLNIMHLRDRFSSGADKGAVESRSYKREVMKNIRDEENSPTSSQVREKVVVDSETKSKEAEPMTISKKSTKEVHHLNEKTINLKSSNENMVDKAQDHIDSHSASNSDQTKEDIVCSEVDVKRTAEVPADTKDLISAKTVLLSGREEEADDKAQIQDCDIACDTKDKNHTENTRALESNHDWISEYSQPRSDWDEQEVYDMQFFDTNHDWISDIARPRSDWECMRQQRYQEMLDPFSENRDIKQLLERRSVSSFLSSGLRDKIDQLMVSRTQGQSLPVVDARVEKQEREVYEESESRKEQTLKVVEKEEEKQREEEEEDDKDHDDDSLIDEYEETGSRLERQYSDYSEIDQTGCLLQGQSPRLERSWSHNGDHEIIYDSHQMASPSAERSFASNLYSQNNTRQSSLLVNHPSIEMEIIYDLRGHMEQLHQEIMELRKSIKSCVNMQIKMQRGIKQDIAAPVTHSVEKEGRESLARVPGKSGCFVCSEQIDSVFYRCGHMCACFSCALDLQFSSGKCPICEAPIVDVVKAYTNGR